MKKNNNNNNNDELKKNIGKPLLKLKSRNYICDYKEIIKAENYINGNNMFEDIEGYIKTNYYNNNKKSSFS